VKVYLDENLSIVRRYPQGVAGSVIDLQRAPRH
jgi:hypothetical protein